jgi:hypothetical protein
MASLYRARRQVRDCVVPLHFLAYERGLCGLRIKGALILVVSLEDAVAILNKWKNESTNILLVAESPFRHTLRGIEGHGVRWHIGQHGKVSRVSFPAEETRPNPVIVDFEDCVWRPT